MKQLAYLNKYFIRYKWQLIWGIVFVFVSNYFRILQPQMIRQAMDLVVDNISYYRLSEGYAAREVMYGILSRTLMYFGIVVLVLALLMGLFMYFMRQTIIVMSRLVEYDLRKEIFAHYSKLNVSFYKRNNTGDLMARITEDVSKVRMALGPAILYSINMVSLFMLTIYSMISVNPELTFYSLLPLPVLSLSIYYISDKINRKSEKIQQQLATLNSIAQEVYSGIRVVKSYVQEKFMGQYFRQESEEYRTRSLSLARVDALFFPLMLLLIGASTIITVYAGGLQVAKGTLTPGNIAEFVIYINMLTWPVTALGWVASLVQQAAASQKRINEFLNVQPEITNHASENMRLKGLIEFDRVTFVYPDSGTVALRNFSFRAEPGRKIAIIGRTGSGKSSVADLLVRLYDVSSGSIRIDGKDIRDHDLANLRKCIGYVPQDVFLFSDTITNNIAFGRNDATREAVEMHARYASIYDEIESLPNGFDTLVGERGVTLSGGQKQRISIARALIKDPDILLLDDCLSAVDSTTEQHILNYLNQTLKDKTTILITHRFSALPFFDHILLVEDGTIIEAGSHDSLMAKQGIYADLFEQQQLREEDVL